MLFDLTVTVEKSTEVFWIVLHNKFDQIFRKVWFLNSFSFNTINEPRLLKYFEHHLLELLLCAFRNGVQVVIGNSLAVIKRFIITV